MPAYRSLLPVVVFALLSCGCPASTAQETETPLKTQSREAGEARPSEQPRQPADQGTRSETDTGAPATTAPEPPRPSDKDAEGQQQLPAQADTPKETTQPAVETESSEERAPQADTAEKPDHPAKESESRQQASPQAETPKVADSAPEQEAGTPSKDASSASRRPQLPADAISQHSLELPGRTLRFEATAGSIPLHGADDGIEARMSYVAYTLNGPDAKTRPVAFAFNGGPGSSAAWLHLGTLGPWRLPFEGDGMRPSAPGVAIPNSETWLDFADLVMIDPIGTGYSRFEAPPPQRKSAVAAEKGGRGSGQSSERRGRLKKFYWSVSGDVNSIARFISKWVAKNDRYRSPKLLVGESYGGFRVPKLAHELQTDFGIGVGLLVLVSPVLDYSFLRTKRHLPLKTVALLPSLAAAALEGRSRTPSPAHMREAEDYARGEYLADLLRGPRDTAAVGRIVKRVAALTGLPAETVRAYGGRLDSFGYRRETNQATGRIASAYDATIVGLSPEPAAPNAHFQDPFVTALRAPLTGAILDLYADKLGWRPEARYFLINGDVSGSWQYGNSPTPPESVSDLKSVLALDPRLRVLVAHGYTDLVTPYFASKLMLDQLPAYDDARRVIQVTYPGGHMFYSRDGSRAAFREDVLIMLAASLNGEARTR